MKFNYLLAALVLFTVSTQAQFTFKDGDGNVYNDGDVYLTNSTVYEESAIDYVLVNDAATDIYVKAELVSATGDPADFEICFGLCYTGVEVGQQFPANGANLIAQGGDSGPGNHMYNAGSNGDDVLDYVVRFFQTDETGETEIGPEFTITYRYDPQATLGLNEVTNLGVTLQSTVVNENLVVNALNDLTLNIYDLQGRVVATHLISSGTQQINVSDLRAQVYVLNFTNAQGGSYTSKVIVR